MLADMEPTRTPLARVQRLVKRFGGVDVFSFINFEVHSGEILGLIGPNGAGKTTLLRCLAGLLPIDDGAVTTSSHNRHELLFYLPDDIVPYGELFAADVLVFFARAFGVEPAVCEHVIRQLDLEPELNRRMSTLSKGNLKRFLLALGLLAPQPVLLLDEPFNSLDVLQTRVVMDLLRDARASGRTLVLAIHELARAEQICDRLLLLARGRFVGAGTLAELRAQTGLPDANLEEIFVALTRRTPDRLFR